MGALKKQGDKLALVLRKASEFSNPQADSILRDGVVVSRSVALLEEQVGDFIIIGDIYVCITLPLPPCLF